MSASGRARNGGLVITALCSVQFVDVLGVTVVVTALPRMLADLRAPASSASLVAGGYALFFGGLLMLGARLGDRFGHRRTITASLAVLAVGALLGAVADSAVLLTAARCLQGAAAAAAVPSALRLLTTLTADGQQRRRAIAAWSAAGASAGASGFVIGGVVTGLTSWRLIFWAYLPLAAALAAAVLRAIPRDRSARPARSLNAAAAAVFTAAVMAVVVGTTLMAQPGQQAGGAAIVLLAAPLTAVFIRVDRRAAAPLLPAAVLQIPALRGGALGSFLNTAATSSAMTLATLYLQDALHHSPFAAAAMLVPFSLAVVAGSALAAPVLSRIKPRHAMATGLAMIAGADAALPAGGPHGWAIAACVAAAGAGLGLSSVAATTLGTTVADTWRGTASGIINTAAQLGTATGVAVVLLIAAATTGLPGPGTGAPSIGWAAAAAIAAAGALAFTRSPRPESATIRATGTDPTAVPAPGNPSRHNRAPARAAFSAARRMPGNRTSRTPIIRHEASREGRRHPRRTADTCAPGAPRRAIPGGGRRAPGRRHRGKRGLGGTECGADHQHRGRR
jgi:MFS family permease